MQSAIDRFPRRDANRGPNVSMGASNVISERVRPHLDALASLSLMRSFESCLGILYSRIQKTDFKLNFAMLHCQPGKELASTWLKMPSTNPTKLSKIKFPLLGSTSHRLHGSKSRGRHRIGRIISSQRQIHFFRCHLFASADRLGRVAASRERESSKFRRVPQWLLANIFNIAASSLKTTLCVSGLAGIGPAARPALLRLTAFSGDDSRLPGQG
jgi:hypothetical protein